MSSVRLRHESRSSPTGYAGKPYPVIQKNLELRKKAVEANREELPHLVIAFGAKDAILAGGMAPV